MLAPFGRSAAIISVCLLKYRKITTTTTYIHTPFNRNLSSTIINKYVQLKIICHNSSLAALQNLLFIWIPVVPALLFSG